MTRRRYVFLGRIGKLYRFAELDTGPLRWRLHEVPVDRFWGRGL